MKKDRRELESQFNHAPLDVPVYVLLKTYRWSGATLHFKRPMSHFKANGDLKPDAPSRHAKRPDVDNLAKYVLDSLQPRVLADDNCVVLCIIQSARR